MEKLHEPPPRRHHGGHGGSGDSDSVDRGEDGGLEISQQSSNGIGGSGRPDEVRSVIARDLQLSDADSSQRGVAPPIELVDGEKLAGMLEKLELGLKPKQTFELDRTFFDEYRQ